MTVENSKLFFPVPKSLFIFQLDACEIATYVYLKLLEDRKTHKCWPSYRTIGEAIGRSRNSVEKYVAGLEKRKLITTEYTKVVTGNGEVHNGTLMYHIEPIWDVVDEYQKFLLEEAGLWNEKRRVAAILRPKFDASAPVTQEEVERGFRLQSKA